jgi:Autotransporter beta-domain
VLHRQLARLLGTEYAARPDLIADVIADAVLCGLGQQQGLAGGIAFAPMGPRWCAWASPRQVNYSDDRNGLKFSGTIRDITFGLDYRVTPDLVVGVAFTPEDTKVNLQGVDVSFTQSGIGVGPYLGWRIRPTTIFDVWAGYTHLDRSFDIIGNSASAQVDRYFVAANLTEFITTPWMRIIPRLSYFQQQDRAQGFTTNTGITLLGTPYDYSFMESSVELNRDILFTNWMLTPFVRATARYYTQRLVEQVNTIDDNVLDIGRWQGQLRGGLRAQFGPQFQLSLSGGYLSLGTEGVDAWEARAILSARF